MSLLISKCSIVPPPGSSEQQPAVLVGLFSATVGHIGREIRPVMPLCGNCGVGAIQHQLLDCCGAVLRCGARCVQREPKQTPTKASMIRARIREVRLQSIIADQKNLCVAVHDTPVCAFSGERPCCYFPSLQYRCGIERRCLLRFSHFYKTPPGSMVPGALQHRFPVQVVPRYD